SKILSNGRWQHHSLRLGWDLHKGDFRELIASAPAPDMIFYDPFSYKTDSALWTAETFSSIYQCCSTKSAELYTYSASTAVRVALLQAGFFISTGAGTGPKSETTIAFTTARGAANHPLRPPLLDQTWLRRWRRSGAKFPARLASEERSNFEKLIETHPQFSVASINSGGTI
ncbi:MAG: MnmC family methyltransferase, partial [Candidatus Binatia bacterium]